MALSSELVSQIAKATKQDTKEKVNTTVYGETVEYNGEIYVKLDGSDRLTPVNTTTALQPQERVVVEIKNHTATVTGNLSSPSARNSDVENINSQITEMDIVIANKVNTKELEAQVGRIDTLVSDNVTIKETLTASTANIAELQADNVTIKEKLTANEAEIDRLSTTKLDAEIADITYASIDELEAVDADIHNLEADYGDFKVLTADKFSANDGVITNLKATKLDAESAKLTYANIDFSNIGKAAMEYLYAASGLIKDVVISNGTITGNLIGVTIKGDLIEGNTIVADKLVIKGEDGIYYKLNTDGVKIEAEQTDHNSLNGSIITAKSITATKISVDDLVAFDATIGGFNITESSIYSGVKETVGNTTRGVYLDKDGQVAFGDSANFLKYYKSSDGTYKLEICANNIKLGSKTIGNLIDEGVDDLEIGCRNLIPNSKVMSDFVTSTYSAIDSEDDEGFAIGRYIARDTLAWNSLNTPYIPYTLVRNRTITLSFWIRSDDYEALNAVSSQGLAIDARVYPKENPSTGNKYKRFLNIYTQPALSDEWQLVSATATITDDYFTNIASAGVDMSNPDALNFRFNMYNYSLYTMEVKKFKLEYGDKATDWSPAPEDLATSGDVINAQTTANDAVSRVANTEATIEILKDAIAMMVVDGNGASLMTQTENGWTFNIGTIVDQLGTAESDIGSLSEGLEEINATLSKHGQSIDDLGTLSSYVRITETEDGDPCIELGSVENDFKLRITNTKIEFYDGSFVPAYVSNESLYIGKAVIEDELQIGSFVWKERANGNVGLMWRGGS